MNFEKSNPKTIDPNKMVIDKFQKKEGFSLKVPSFDKLNKIRKGLGLKKSKYNFHTQLPPLEKIKLKK